MQAARDIKRGECILEESPLFQYPRIPPDNHRDELFEENKQYNGLSTIEEVIAQTPLQNLDRLRRLKSSSASAESAFTQPSDISIINTNAFTHQPKVVGIRYSYINVFDDISRCNHSCRPSALVEWNPTKNKGTLHALEAIPTGKEITIDYLGKAEDTLITSEGRRKKLASAFGFQCSCEICGASRDQIQTDDAIRVKAFDLYKAITSAGTDVLKESSLLTLALHKKWQANRNSMLEYVELLKRLGVKDAKLAEAFNWLAQSNEQGYYLARRRLELVGRRQSLKVAPEEPSVYLKQAIHNARLAWSTELVFTGASYPWHPATNESHHYMAQLEQIKSSDSMSQD